MNPIQQKQQSESAKRASVSRLYAIIAVLLFGFLAFQLWSHAASTSVTVDEVPHILAGYRYWQCGDFAINPEHPPLLKLLAASPLNFRAFIAPAVNCGLRPTTKLDGLLDGFLFLAKNGADSIVIPARVAASLMSLLLALLVFFAAREMFGRAIALAALALFVFEPNIIAHGSLVTTDMAVSAGFFAAVYALYRYRKSPSVIRFLIVGFGVGLTLAAKHSGILVVPILFLLLTADVFLFRKTEIRTRLSRQVFRQAAVFAGILFVGFVLLWASYGFRYYALPNSTESVLLNEILPPVTDFTNPKSFLKQTARTFAQILPESYVVGFADVMATNSRPMILFGELYPTGKWFYFPVAFLIKTSVALLVLLSFGLLNFKLYREYPREVLFLLLPPLVYFAFSLTSEMNIGVRHLLPVYAFFIVIAAAGACALVRKYQIALYILIVLLIFHAAATVRTAPNYIAFANDFWGGTNNTHRLLADSNVEWGQNLKLVNQYLAAEKINDCWFANYGGGELARINQPCKLLPGSFAWDATEEPVERVPSTIEGTILLSVAVFPPRGGAEYSQFLQAEPIAFIGGSVFVYRGRFEIPLASALSYAARSGQLVRLNRFEEAVTDARKAVELAPDDPRPHIALGTALSRKNEGGEARGEFETTIRLAESNSVLYGQIVAQAREELERLQ